MQLCPIDAASDGDQEYHGAGSMWALSAGESANGAAASSDRWRLRGTVVRHGKESAIGNYVREQGQEYTPLHVDHQLALL